MSLRSLRSAIGFLTVVPVGSASAGPAQRLGRAWFPAVGALTGLAAGAVFVGARELFPPFLAAVAAVAAGAALTGGLHLDGLADAADGLLGGHTRERRLEIMRDPRLGSYGAVALFLVLSGEVAALTAMQPRRALVGLVVAGALSRFGLLCVVALLPYVRAEGLGVAAVGGRRALDVFAGALLTAIACLLDPRRAVVAALAAAVAVLIAAALAWRRIGGATGDVYGACTELSQLAALIVFAAP